MKKSYDVTNPFTHETLASYCYSTWPEIESNLAMLKKGKLVQRATAACERADVLLKLSGLLRDNADQLAELITRETGKTISDSRIEISRAINAAIACGEEARQISGENLDSDAYAKMGGKMGITCWRPLGVVLCITPFNFPINIAVHKIGPAFAAGNTILFKPGPQNTASATLLVELCYRAGIPESVLQFCMPELSDMNAINAHPDIDAINFTGGSAAAKAIGAVSGYKKLLLELGGNDPLIVMADGDIEKSVNVCINQRFATAGQRCTAVKRVFVHRSIFSQFRDLLVEKTASLKVGDPMDEDTFIGPVINQAAADVIKQRIESAIVSGAKILIGHQYDGALVYPTILDQVDVNSEIMLEETFGPVLPLCPFDDVNDIIPIINNTAYGLQAGIFTDQLSVVRKLFEELEVGTLACNDGPGFRTEHFPFGGVKASGLGREGIKYAIREMSYIKTLVI